MSDAALPEIIKPTLTSPTMEQIAAARKRAGMTQKDAAALIGVKARSWRGWESSDDALSATAMPPDRWFWFLVLTGQHPEYELVRRKK